MIISMDETISHDENNHHCSESSHKANRNSRRHSYFPIDNSLEILPIMEVPAPPGASVTVPPATEVIVAAKFPATPPE